MADYKEFLNNINREAYHEGEWQWQEGEYTVTRTYHYSPPGCHNSCGVLLYTKDGKLEKVEGDPLDPHSNGKLCIRCLNMPEAVNHPDRLKYPLKRVGKRGENKWERISWDEAYDTIEKKVKEIKKEYGSESIVGIHGTGRNINYQLPYFYQAGLETPNVAVMFFTGFACYLPRVVGSFAAMGEFVIVDASQAHEDRYMNEDWKPPACIIVWGNDPVKSNGDGFLGHWLVQCMQMGSKLIVIDPRLTWLAARADYWLQVRPGTDAAMALGMLNVIIGEDLYDHDFVDKWCFGLDALSQRVAEYPAEKVAEICDVPAEKIRGAARLFAKSKPSAVQWGLAFEQQISCMPLTSATISLFAITGNVDVPGGMLMVRAAFDTQRMYNYGEEFLPEGKMAKKLNSDAKGIAESSIVPHASSDVILHAIETGEPYPIKMAWIQSSNSLACPAMDAPRAYEALKKIDFIVYADPYMTPTAVAAADIVLPVAMSCERNSARSWWTPLRSMTKVTQYYEAKSDEEIIVDMGRRLNPKAFPFKNDVEFIEAYIKNDGNYPGTFEELRNKGGHEYWEWDTIYRKYEKGMLREDGNQGFATPTGRIELTPNAYGFWGLDPLPYHIEPPESPVSTPEMFKEYPLIMTTGGRSWEFFHSEHRQLKTMRELHPDPLMMLNPETAAKYDIKEGDWVWIESPKGRFKQKATFFPGLKPYVIHTEHAWWFPEKEAAEPSLFGVFDSNPNNLTPAGVVGKGGIGSPIKSMLVKIYKVEEGVNDQVMPTMQVTRMGGFKNVTK
ncbi:MAG: molybdopterin-dependent oxidoreductase [Anaerolineales bacterium]|nr:molybdopterin-dependent oxidoreductase [Anaerolineales bacterium]